MPKLWNETIESHRAAVRDATLDATATLVRKYGLHAVTMSQIAETTGIGRATLYKYFPDVETILVAWHERHIAMYLEQMTALKNAPGDIRARLTAILETYAASQHANPGGELSAMLHRGPHVAHAHEHLRDLLRELIKQGARSGRFRSDVAADELAAYCLHALAAASTLRSKAAVRRLVMVTLAGLRPKR